MKLVFIGSGNVAWHLSKALQAQNHEIVQVMSPTFANAKALAEQLKDCNFTTRLEDLNHEADLYLLCTRDNAILEVLPYLKGIKGIVAHTSGSTPLSIFEGQIEHYGVFYPFQTFSKQKEVDFKSIPMCIEGKTPEIAQLLVDLARSISSQVELIDSQQRLYLHLTAIYTNNFANHLFYIAQEVLHQQNIPHDFLNPLIQETFEKLKTVSPFEAQTGPAKRNDTTTIHQHLRLLEAYPKYQKIYQVITESIIDTYTPKDGTENS